MAVLSKKQQVAVDMYLKGMTKQAAARAAGYERAKDVFKSPVVQKEVDRLQAMVREKTAIEIQDVLDGLMEGVNAAQNTADLVMAWREIGRIIGAYEHAKHIKVDVTSKIEHLQSMQQLERLSTEDLAELADMGDKLLIEDADYEELDQDDSDSGTV